MAELLPDQAAIGIYKEEIMTTPTHGRQSSTGGPSYLSKTASLTGQLEVSKGISLEEG